MENYQIKLGKTLVYLISCRLKKIIPEQLDVSSANEVFKLAKYNGLGAIAASALRGIGLATEEMTNSESAAMRKNLLLDLARGEISAALTKAGIWHLPLKGVVLKDLYPALGLREMSDNDVLFDPSRRSDVRSVMESLGFEVESFGSGCHDVYMKKPVHNFEMHVSLFAETESKLFTEYFTDFYPRTRKVGDNEYLRSMTDEDFYLYVKAHEYKHFSSGGIGVRALVDTFVFLDAKGGSLRRDYLNSELARLGIADYESEVAALAQKLLSPDTSRSLFTGELQLTEREEDLFAYFLGSGTHGNMENKINNAISGMESDGNGSAKGRYVLSRLFPPLEWYKVNAPFYYEHRLLIPFYIVKRLFKKVILAPGRAFSELRRVIKAKGKNKDE